MKATEMPSPHRPTKVRQLLRWAELLRYRLEYRRRLRELLHTVSPGGAPRLTADELRAVKQHWARHGIERVSPTWYQLFKALTGQVDPRYVPEETFRTRLEPLLCRRDVSAAYHDKNQLDRLFAKWQRPRTVLRNIYGHYYDADYAPVPRGEVVQRLAGHSGPHFLKPAISGTGSGHNVARLAFEPGGFRLGEALLSLDELERIYVQDFVIQEQVRQHEGLARFHAGSLNTLRLITLRLGEDLEPIAATFRMGNGSHVDNGHAGGLLAGVDLASGGLTRFACDVLFRRHERHPISGQEFAGQSIPSFPALRELALGVHALLPYFDVLSCDLAVLEDGSPCLIEVNTFGQGVEPHQFLKGAPLFGDKTDEVLALVARRARLGWNP